MLLDSERVRRLRLERGWTQEQAAELCDVSVRTIQRIEKTGLASLETTSAVAAVFGVERTDLLARSGVRTARSELPLRNVVVIAIVMFALGVGVGLYV